MKSNELKALATRLQEYALGFPGAYEEFPWGERVIKVNKKVFIFLGKVDKPTDELSFSVKLPASAAEALELPYTEPTGYGLGKSGWVSVRLSPGTVVSSKLFQAWIDESYRSIAPKKLVAQLSKDG
jgi:predicted DNA-binding protein (MmcQ/YjbR family)